MNTQEIIRPIGKFIEWTFVNVYEPIADPFNAGVLILGLVSLVIWLKVLNGYVARAIALDNFNQNVLPDVLSVLFVAKADAFS
ncbi:MAG: hypothetical protein ACKVHK_01780 [Flavobacteriales bacterium]